MNGKCVNATNITFSFVSFIGPTISLYHYLIMSHDISKCAICLEILSYETYLRAHTHIDNNNTGILIIINKNTFEN